MRKHPELGNKLLTLYRKRLNPNVTNNVDLANKLGVSKQAVSRWCRGTSTISGDSIPNLQLIPVSNVFGIEPLWFSLDFPEFELAVDSRVRANDSEQMEKKELVSISMLPNTGLDIFGRENEIMKLNDFWQSNTTNVVQIVAFGGVGKSSLVNKWLSEMSKERYRYANRVYAWSFHWQGDNPDSQASGDFFIEHALEWFGDESPTKGTSWARAIRLARLIRKYRALVILDGIECVLYPPGENEGMIECPAIEILVKELASGMDGLCVLTTRMPVSELDSFKDGRVAEINLKNLSTDAGVNLLDNLGVKGNEVLCSQAVDSYKGHALSLTLLAGYLSVVHQGDITHFRDLDSLLEEKRNSEKVRNIMRAYLDWYDSQTLEILELISVSDREVSLRELKKLVELDSDNVLRPDLKEFEEEDWAYKLSVLERSKIISMIEQRGDIEIDCHPIVRDYLNEEMRKNSCSKWMDFNQLIFKYLVQLADCDPASINDLEPLCRAVVHGARANCYRDAYEVYFEKIKKRQFSVSTEFSHQLDHVCIKSFFDHKWDKPIDELEEEAKIYLLTSASTNLIYLGRIAEALRPSYRSIEWFLDKKKWHEAAAAAGPLVSMLIAAGELNEAQSVIDQILPTVEGGNEFLYAMALNFKGYVSYLQGDREKAGNCFEVFDRVIASPSPPSNVQLPTISAYYIRYLLDIGRGKEALERALQRFAWRETKSWQTEIDTASILGSDTLTLGIAYLDQGDVENASKYLHKQIEIFRDSEEWLYLPTGLNFRARYYVEVGQFSLAEKDLDESIAISKRTGATFGEWEAYLEFARLYASIGNIEKGRGYLEEALNLPKMNQFRFRQIEIEKLKSKLSA